MQFDCSAFLQSGCLTSVAGKLWVGWGDVQQAPSSQGISVYAPDFFLEDAEPWIHFPNAVEIHRDPLISFLQEASGDSASEAILWEKTDFSHFRTQFSDLKAEIDQGALQKAVLIVLQKGHWSYDTGLLGRLLQTLLKNTAQFPFYLYGAWGSHRSGILGASPELLLGRASASGRFKTMALAGTRLSGQPGDLLEDPKERFEHQVVVDGICESLRKMPEFKSLHVGQIGKLQLPTLTHLYTPIEFEVSAGQQVFLDLVRVLHPTPALGAFPKDLGWEWLKRDPFGRQRRRFGAPFGSLLPTGEMECIVAIRNIQWNIDHVLLGAGCGVVAPSELERECQELGAKLASVKKLLGIEGAESNES